jgi:hypothetical protein
MATPQQSYIEPFKDENYTELYLKIQFVPRSKHTPSQLYKPVS